MENTNINELYCNVGETITIFTKSGGISGSGFTGVVTAVNHCFIRLITRFGPAPSCALGSACNQKSRRGCCGGSNNGLYGGTDYCNGFCNSGVGSVTDIPIDAIVAIVHNAV
ncbi:MAG: hypothetical protein VB118_07900 [Oscillospiraceae bacterium]|nr:hypothetical protein [Oscillospiraceae bacterium]